MSLPINVVYKYFGLKSQDINIAISVCISILANKTPFSQLPLISLKVKSENTTRSWSWMTLLQGNNGWGNKNGFPVSGTVPLALQRHAGHTPASMAQVWAPSLLQRAWPAIAKGTMHSCAWTIRCQLEYILFVEVYQSSLRQAFLGMWKRKITV